jgi:hypothetical protein
MHTHTQRYTEAYTQKHTSMVADLSSSVGSIAPHCHRVHPCIIPQPLRSLPCSISCHAIVPDDVRLGGLEHTISSLERLLDLASHSCTWVCEIENLCIYCYSWWQIRIDSSVHTCALSHAHIYIYIYIYIYIVRNGICVSAQCMKEDKSSMCVWPYTKHTNAKQSA